MDDKERGVYEKYTVIPDGETPLDHTVVRNDGDPTGKHQGCSYFVLDLDHDPHAIPALKAYVRSLQEAGEYGGLANDLNLMIKIKESGFHV